MSDTMTAEKTHETLVGTCAVCTRGIAVDAKGKLVHHGFKRPGNGYIYGDCFGVGYEPYERSTQGCKAWRQQMELQVGSSRAHLAALKNGEVRVIRLPTFGYRKAETLVCGVTELTRFEAAHAHEVGRVEADIRGFENEVTRMDHYIADWKLVELTSETRADAAARAEKEARKVERATKKAAKEAKAAALKAKREAQIQTTLDFIAEWSVMFASGDAALDAAAARDCLALMEKVAKKAKLNYSSWSTSGPSMDYPKEFGLRNLMSDARAIELGLARISERGVFEIQ